jgi:hypothetical protein
MIPVDEKIRQRVDRETLVVRVSAFDGANDGMTGINIQ